MGMIFLISPIADKCPKSNLHCTLDKLPVNPDPSINSGLYKTPASLC